MKQEWRSRIIGTGDEDPSQLVANPKNWRIHPKPQQDALADVLERVGWVQQVLVNKVTGNVVDGHLRVELALSRGESSVPVLYVELDESEEALILASLDPLASMAATDEAKLRDLLAEVELNDDLESLLADLAGDQLVEGQTDADDVPPEPDDADVYVKPGDLWLLGEHRLLCGDATSAEDVVRLMDGAKAAVMVTDPPYGVAYRDTGKGAWNAEKLARKKAGTLRPRFDAIESDELTGPALIDLWEAFLRAGLAVMAPHGAVYCCFASLRSPEVFAAYDAAGLEPRAELVWVKSRPGFNFAHYKHQHEPILYGCRKNGSVDWYGDRTQTSVIEVASESGKDYLHPTQKPVGLLERPIANSSRPKDIVLEPFSGSGTTIIAAEQLGRRCYAMELEPKYVQVAKERWEAFTGKEAVRVEAEADA